MNDATVEQKLELVQQIRSQYNKNQYDLLNREQILYGRALPRDSYTYENPAEEAEPVRSTFKLRLFAAGLLFILLVALDITGKSIACFETGKIFTILAQDYEKQIDAWVEANM